MTVALESLTPDQQAVLQLALVGAGGALKSRTNAIATIDRILARAAAAAVSNPRTAGTMATADKPAVTESGTEPDISVYQRLPSAGASTPANYLPYVAPVGGWLVGSANQLYVYSVTKTIGAATGGGSATAYQTTARHIFYTNAARVSFGINNADIVNWRLLTDGKFYDTVGFTPTATGQRYWTLDFSATASPNKIRRIEVEVQSSPNNPTGFGRLYIPGNSTIWAPTAAEIGPRVSGAGDSFMNSANAAFKGDGFFRYMGDMLGLPDVVSSGLSGSGYIEGGNSDAAPNTLERITDVTSLAPDVVAVFQGFNDLANDGQTGHAGLINVTTTAAAAATYAANLRAALPNVPIVVFAPWRSGSSTLRGKQQAWSDAIQAAIAGLNDPLTVFRPLSGIFSGLGDVDSPYSGALTFTGALTGATTATLTSGFVGPTSTAYSIIFSDGSVRNGVTLTNGSTTVSWTSAVTATANATYTHANAGTADLYVTGLTDKTHPKTFAGHAYIASIGQPALIDALRTMRQALAA